MTIPYACFEHELDNFSFLLIDAGNKISKQASLRVIEKSTLYGKHPVVIQPTISLQMPVPSQGHYGFHSFPVVN